MTNWGSLVSGDEESNIIGGADNGEDSNTSEDNSGSIHVVEFGDPCDVGSRTSVLWVGSVTLGVPGWDLGAEEGGWRDHFVVCCLCSVVGRVGGWGVLVLELI